MNSKIHFKNDNLNMPNLNLLIAMAYEISNQSYVINEFKTEKYDINITFFSNNIDGSVNYENGGNLSIEVSDSYECMRLFNIINDKVFNIKK